jgi:PTS system nitrogen regulatory IIA component
MTQAKPSPSTLDNGGSGMPAVTRVMNVDEVARYLRVVPDTIYRKARRGEIPAVKMGKVWRFPKETLDKWLNDAALGTVKKD